MKRTKMIYYVLIAVIAALGMSACSADLSDVEQEVYGNRHTVRMRLVGDVVGFDQTKSAKAKAQTRSISMSWNNGDKIYVTFYNGSSIVPGEATYSSTSGWVVSYDGDLATGSSLKCEARYFVNATFTSSSLVTLDSNSEIYEDLNAIYTYNNGFLTVTATLSPKTGRIRFSGKSGDKIHTMGISVYTTFSPAINTFSTSDAMITSTVASNGYTPYIYGAFADDERKISLFGSDYAFTRTCTSSMFNKGESGYMAIPSEASHNNWRSGLYVKASGVEFKMIPVAGFSEGFFMMAETETTEGLYMSVFGAPSTSQLPIDNVAYPNILSFIEKLNNETKLNFALPTAEQWKYAAKGGNRTQGYTYAGSNTPGDVAWYSANCSAKQNVKTKAPNELGIYDMSGNVGEFVASLFQNNYPYIYGGGYCSNFNYVTNEMAVNTRSSYKSAGFNFGSIYTYDDKSCHCNGVGFRLILKID